MKYKLRYEHRQSFYDNYLYFEDGRWFIERLKIFLIKELNIDVDIVNDYLIRVPYKISEEKIYYLRDNYGLYVEPIDFIDVDELLIVLLKNEEYNAMSIILDKFIL